MLTEEVFQSLTPERRGLKDLCKKNPICARQYLLMKNKIYFNKLRRICIAYFIDQLGVGGTEKQLQYVLEGLDRTRFKPYLFLLREHKVPFNVPSDVETFVLNVGSLLTFDTATKLYKCARTLKRIQCGIVQTFFQDASIFGVLAAKLAGVPRTIVSIRDMLFWSTGPMHLAHRLITTMAHAILVNSFAIKDHIKSFYPEHKIHVIHNGLPVGLKYVANQNAKNKLAEELGISNEIPIVVMVSNYNRAVKRVDLLIESVPLVLKETPAYFVIVGDGHLKPKLEARIAELKIEECVKLIGQRHDVEEILAGSDVAVSTSDSEGFSNSILEAMRAGIPVVASDVEANRELFAERKFGFLFSPGDAENLAEKLNIAIKNINCTRSKSEADSKRTNREYSVYNMLTKHKTFYDALLLCSNSV